jgi:hypothetical protein
MNRIICILLLLGLTTTQANAIDDALVIGAGAATCAEYKQTVRNDENAEYLFYAWAQGYLSGLNQALVTTNKRAKKMRAPAKELEGAIRRYCDKRPVGYYRDAVLQMFLAFPDQ